MCCGCISSSNIGIIERFGKFNKIAEPGLYFKLPIIDVTNHIISTKRKQLLVSVDTKTSDNVFCKIIVAVIFSVKPENIYNAVYGYENIINLINSYVQNEVRSELSRISLDESFLQKLTISDKIKQSLKNNISFGYNFHEVLINDIEPEKEVRDAMNEINKQHRLRIAKEEQSNAYKMEIITKAEADANSAQIKAKSDATTSEIIAIANANAAEIKAISDAKNTELLAVGQSKSKSTLIDGIRNSFTKEFSDDEIVKLFVASQQMDTFSKMCMNGKSSTIFVPYGDQSRLNLNL